MSHLRIAAPGEKPRRWWTCSVCGKLGVWDRQWQWYGSYKQLEERPESIVVMCSDECRANYSKVGVPL